MSAIRQGTAECIRSFQTLSAALLTHNVFRSMISTEALEDEQGRFRVWSGNLGALQKGHSSLDYRLRDSPLLRTNVLKLLNELGTNLSETLAVVSGDRLPYEQQPRPDESEDGDDVWSQDEDSGEDEAPKTELEQRFLDIVDIVDNLYKLSVRIRSPTLRSRSLKAASYRPVDPDTGIDVFEQYALFDLQHTRELLSHLRPDSSDQENEENNYLIERLSNALTLRRRQFKYWRRHRDKLGTSSDIGDIRPQLLPEQQEIVEIGTPADKTTGDRALNVIKAPTSEWMPKSLLSGTEATQHHHSLDEVVDNQSVTSYATTARDLTGRGIELPSPPKAATGERDFECPYCFIICPARYRKGRAWRTHILQDLQPYVCTYKDCKGSDQLFRSRREWSEHEAGHRKLWRCPEHINAVFRSSSNLEDHLHREHPGSFPEEQLSSIIRVGETSAIDLRQACPICFVAAAMEGGMQNHIANHLERLAVFALPKDVDSTEDESDGASSAASRGRSVGSSDSQHLISESSYSDSISRQSDNAAYVDSDLASKISRLTSETQVLGSETVPLKQEVTNALSADLLTLLPDASNQKMDMFFLSSQQHSEVTIPESISTEPGNPIRNNHLELQKQSTNRPEDADWPSTLLQQKGEDFGNVLPELPELQADRQQALPITFDGLAKDQHTEDTSGSGTDQEKFYYANKLSDISDEIENAAQRLTAFVNNIPNFEQEVTIPLSSIASTLEALGKLFTSSENPIRKFTRRTASDLDLLCTVLQSISESVVEMAIQAKYTREFGAPTYNDFWDDFNFHLKNNQGLSFLPLLNMCMSFAGGLSDILRNGTGNTHMDVMRDRLARYRLKQTGKDAEEAHNRIFEEVLLSREFTSQSIAEFHASDIVKASRIPNLNNLYRFGHLSRVPTNSKANPAANDIICLIRYDITRLEVDVIVNSTDAAFSSLGSLDKAIFRAGGPDMRKAISKFGICMDGSVKLTEGYQLPCKYVYHAIPPKYYHAIPPNYYQSRGAFRKCYSNSLEMALKTAARTIAFPAIGAGLLGYPRFEAVSIAIEEVQKFLAQHKTRVIDKIIFCVFEEADESMYRMLLPKYFPPANDSLNMMEVPNLEVGGNSKGNETAPIPIPGATTLKPTKDRAEASPSPDPPQDIYIAVMGQTGTGKTSFIQDATGKKLKVGHTLRSCTQNIEEVGTRIGGRTIKFIDTPGFDDTVRSDTDVLEIIGTYLQKAYSEKIFLTGIIYLQRITDVRMQGSAVRNLRILRKLCGPNYYSNVVLATIGWDEVNYEEGEYREKQLKSEDEYWAEFIKEGATVRRHKAGKESAISIVEHLLDKTPAFLQFQRELAERGIIGKTEVGEEVISYLAELNERNNKKMEVLWKELEDANNERIALMKALDVRTEKLLAKQEMETLKRDIEKKEAYQRSLETDIRKLSETVEKSSEDMRKLNTTLEERMAEDKKLLGFRKWLPQLW